jgi:hypothetical protein
MPRKPETPRFTRITCLHVFRSAAPSSGCAGTNRHRLHKIDFSALPRTVSFGDRPWACRIVPGLLTPSRAGVHSFRSLTRCQGSCGVFPPGYVVPNAFSYHLTPAASPCVLRPFAASIRVNRRYGKRDCPADRCGSGFPQRSCSGRHGEVPSFKWLPSGAALDLFPSLVAICFLPKQSPFSNGPNRDRFMNAFDAVSSDTFTRTSRCLRQVSACYFTK